MKKVLIILCSYNGEKYIKEQVISIISQIGIEFSLLVFDDRSLDNTIKVLNSINDPRIRVVENKFNSGSPALNFINSINSLDQNFISQFDYISLSDQDDIWDENKLLNALNKIIEHDATLYASNLTLWDKSNNIKKLIKKDFEQKKYDFLFEGASAGCTYVFATSFVVEFKEIIKKININKWEFISHDWLIYFCARIMNRKVYIDKNSYISYRIHESNVHGQLNIKSLASLFKRVNLVLNQWYFIQSFYFSKLLNEDSDEWYIYQMYNKSWFTRFWILVRYNFMLMRSRKKFLQFVIVSLFPKRKRNKL